METRPISKFEVIDAGNGKIVKVWNQGISIEEKAMQQIKNTASLPFVFKYVAVMPDAHFGMGSTVGTVLPTIGAVVPAAVGVDIGCGMLAIKTDVNKEYFECYDLKEIRKTIEEAVPAGRTNDGGKGDRGAWSIIPQYVQTTWNDQFEKDYEKLCEKHPGARAKNTVNQLGTLGTGNHFIELCEDEQNHVWIVLHSGSRGMGNRIGSYFTQVAKKLCEDVSLPDKDLSYLLEESEEFSDYKGAVTLAQAFAWQNRMLMAGSIIAALANQLGIRFQNVEIIHCHHNYISWENHFGKNVIVTRKGAVKAAKGDMGIIPGCFAADTRILMADGSYKDISQIVIGDKVIGGNGQPTVVTNVFNKGIRPTWSYRNNRFHKWSVVTPDHLHFIGDLSSANYQQQGRLEIIDRLTKKKKSKYTWSSLAELPSSFTLLLPHHINFSEMPSNFSLNIENLLLTPTYELGYIFGTFLGDGSCYYAVKTGGQVDWSFGVNEEHIATRLVLALNKAFGLEAKIYHPEKQNIILVVVHSVSLSRIFSEFGKRANKALPAKFWCSEKNYLRGLCDGLIASDGCLQNGELSFSNTSTKCIEQYGIIHYLLLGYFPGISRCDITSVDGGDTKNYNQCYVANSLKLPLLAKNHQLVGIMEDDFKEKEVEVFDIEVESEQHSFIANNVIVHNSMGARTYIVRGLGNPDSFNTCSHGAGRSMSRTQALKTFSIADHEKATEGVECLKDASVLDETPGAYKDIEAVMAAQNDLVEPVYRLKQFVCVKGASDSNRGKRSK